MVEKAATAADDGSTRHAASSCPPWCTAGHGTYGGEEDWLHVGEPVPIAEGLDARLCLSVDPQNGRSDGPYVLLGGTELTLKAFSAMATALVELSRVAPVPAEDKPAVPSVTG